MSKRLDAIEERLDKLESVLSKLGAWIAKKQEQETQANLEKDPVVTKQNEDGEVWFSKPPYFCAKHPYTQLVLFGRELVCPLCSNRGTA